MVISELSSKIVRDFKENGIDNALFEANQILSHVLKIPYSEIVLNSKEEIKEADLNTVLKLSKRRLTREPLQYILETQEFMSLPFCVSPDVLIPRQDTETLVEFVLSETEDLPLSLLDIGTGTGCIPISLAHFKNNFICHGIDVSEKAVLMARKNAEISGVSKRVTFEVADILSNIPCKKFDVITSNPPYIKSEDIKTLQPEVRLFEPHSALDGGDDGLLFYRRICDIAPKILKKGGLLAFEIGFDQADAVFTIMEKNFKDIQIIKDLANNDRVTAGYLN
jgi:release factor glutamine methyltransferase